MPTPPPDAAQRAIRSGIHRQALSIVLAVMPFGVAFGVAATETGLTIWETVGFSTLVFSGGAQFAAVGVLNDGGTALAAVVAGGLLSIRLLAFGVVMAPALAGPMWRRAAWSQLMIDESTAVGVGQDTVRWQRYGYLVTGSGIFVGWNLATLAGYVLLSSAGDAITDFGIDAAIPASFLALVWPRFTSSDQRRVALAGALLALALVPITPAGIPIIAAGLGVAVGWRQTEATS